jgi:hypothetical protein
MPIVIGTIPPQEDATFTVIAPAVATANNKSMVSLLNGSGSPVALRLLRAYLINVQTGSVTGVVATFEWRRITGHSAGASLNPQAHDSSDVLDAAVSTRTGATVAGEDAALLHRALWSTDEWGPGPSDTESADHVNQTLFPAWEQAGSRGKPLVLRADEGLTIKCVTNTTTGLFDLILVFAQVTE